MNNYSTLGDISVLSPSQKRELEQKRKKAAEATRKAKEASLAASEKAAEAARQAKAKVLLEAQRAELWLKIKKASLWVVGFVLTSLLLLGVYIISGFLMKLGDGAIFFVGMLWVAVPFPIVILWMLISSRLDDLKGKLN